MIEGQRWKDIAVRRARITAAQKGTQGKDSM